MSDISAAWFEFPQLAWFEFPQRWGEFPQRWAEFPERRPVKFPQRGSLAALTASRFAMSINQMGGYSAGQKCAIFPQSRVKRRPDAAAWHQSQVRGTPQMWRPRRSLLVWRSPESQRASSLCASARRIASISATSSGSWVNSTNSPSGEAT
jgi:hypothetical protein